MKSFFITAFTGADNATYDLGRVLWCLGAGVLTAVSIWLTATGHTDPVQVASAFGLLLTSGAGALAIKAKTEPSCSPSSPPSA